MINPQQIKVNFDKIQFDSCFDSGNLMKVEKEEHNLYNLYISSDCLQSQFQNSYRTWFHFRVTGVSQHQILTFQIKNMNNQSKMYREGMCPVYKSKKLKQGYKRINQPPFDFIGTPGKNLEFSFKHQWEFDKDDVVYFAFTYPFSYKKSLKQLKQLNEKFIQDDSIYFKRNLLTYSIEKRAVEIVTISDHSHKTNKQLSVQNLFPQLQNDEHYQNNTPPFIFDKKQIVVISARVHPGELPSSHVFNGILKFITEKNNTRAQVMRRNFVFIMVPFLNPDGVYRGHYRSDIRGINLNRFYINPNLQDHPSIYAIRELVINLHSMQKLYMYIDLHAHACKRGCFIFGNNMEIQNQIESQLFCKILALNSQIFTYEGSLFSEKNMSSKDKGEKESKEGSSRVALYRATKLPFFFTLECNYNTGLQTNIIKERERNDPNSQNRPVEKIRNPIKYPLKPNQKEKIELPNEYLEYQDDSIIDIVKNQFAHPKIMESQFYTVELFEELGEVIFNIQLLYNLKSTFFTKLSHILNKIQYKISICDSILDFSDLNPQSRIPNTQYKKLDILRLSMAYNLMQQQGYKFEKFTKTILKYLDNTDSVQIKKGMELLANFVFKNLKLDPQQKIEPPIAEKRKELPKFYKQSQKITRGHSFKGPTKTNLNDENMLTIQENNTIIQEVCQSQYINKEKTINIEQEIMQMSQIDSPCIQVVDNIQSNKENHHITKFKKITFKQSQKSQNQKSNPLIQKLMSIEIPIMTIPKNDVPQLLQDESTTRVKFLKQLANKNNEQQNRLNLNKLIKQTQQQLEDQISFIKPLKFQNQQSQKCIQIKKFLSQNLKQLKNSKLPNIY